MASEHPAMELARRGPKGKVDKFLAFWIAMCVDGRQARFEASRARTRRSIEKLFSDRDVVAARELLGEDALAAELRAAAGLYFEICMTDPAYGSTLFRTKRLEPDQVLGKAAADAAGAMGVLAESGALTGVAAKLPRLLAEGFVDATPEGAAGVLRRNMSRIPAAAPLVDVVPE